MNYDDFKCSVKQENVPENLDGIKLALWYAAKGNWEKAHSITQDIDTETASWVHAYLHREEGDIGNAHYWYRRSNREPCSDPLKVELDNILKTVFL